jgi:hypothetical protein
VTDDQADDIANRFSYHAPSGVKIDYHQQVRLFLEDAIHNVFDLLPESREKSLFLTKMEEAMFWANASIARYDAVE